MLGVALSVGAITVLSRSRSAGGPRAIVFAGCLAGLALLTKQTLFAALLAGTFRLWPSGRSMIIYVASALTVFVVPCAALEVTTGGAFLQNTLLSNINPFDLSVGGGLFRELLQQQWLPLLLALVYLIFGCRERLLVTYWLASSLQLIGMTKVGANHNYWIEFAAITSVLAALGVCALLAGQRDRWHGLVVRRC